MTTAWRLVQKTADISLGGLASGNAAESHVPVADFDQEDLRSAVLISGEVVHRRNVLPLSFTEKNVSVATANPLIQETEREVAALTGRAVDFHVAFPKEIGCDRSHCVRTGPKRDLQRDRSGTLVEAHVRSAHSGRRGRNRAAHTLPIGSGGGRLSRIGRSRRPRGDRHPEQRYRLRPRHLGLLAGADERSPRPPAHQGIARNRRDSCNHDHGVRRPADRDEPFRGRSGL